LIKVQVFGGTGIHHHWRISALENIRAIARVGTSLASFIGMSTKNLDYRELLTEYWVALDLWSEAKVRYGPDRPELISAAIGLQEIEDALEVHRTLKAA
jgi:hypothetical protein